VPPRSFIGRDCPHLVADTDRHFNVSEIVGTQIRNDALETLNEPYIENPNVRHGHGTIDENTASIFDACVGSQLYDQTQRIYAFREAAYVPYRQRIIEVLLPNRACDEIPVISQVLISYCIVE
jgi:hypothetical protein